ncbi:MAG: DUF1786 family protein [Archaeoglobales archaeon]|nr:DUF1786 family protein [Archaeoglobales archaeon]
MVGLIFTLDVGSGTQDFLLYVDKNLRNCPKAIMPSPTKILASKIRKFKKDVFLYGYTMGGGAITSAVKEHISKGFRVFADERAALTFSDNLEKVKEIGVKIEKPKGEFESFETKDVDLEFYSKMLSSLDYDLPEIYAIAVQDHGFSPKESNRVFRFRMFEKLLKKSSKLTSLMFKHDEIPAEFNRMRDVASCIKDKRSAEVYVVDTVFAAIAGCSLFANPPALLVNFGNSHLTAAIINENYEITSLLEHHTSVVAKRGRDAVRNLLKKFVMGKLSFEDVFNDGGHGCLVREVIDVKSAVCTGPNSWLLDIEEVKGDPMITGNLGILFMLSEKGVCEFSSEQVFGKYY